MKLTNQNYFSKSDDELRFILRDASEAADAMRGMSSYNPGSRERENTESKYLEQIDDAATVLAQRAKARAHETLMSIISPANTQRARRVS